MERVEFQQEQMLAELKDLEQKGLFSAKEIKIIIKKRTAFERALVRRIPQKSDFLRYAAYEMGLETLRRRRVQRLKIQAPPTLSDYALVRRVLHIFERALHKFRSDVALWVQYIALARREGARALVGRISARALQLHPRTPALYIHVARHETAPSARILLQRGLRLNGDSVELWTAYVAFELGFMERMRRRWGVLGVDIGDGPEGEDMREGEDAESDEARRAIMQGAIVKTVLDSAASALPTLPLFRALHALLSTHPTPVPLRTTLLEHMHTRLLASLPHDPAALALHASRFLPDPLDPTADLESEEFVDILRDANEELRDHAKADPLGVGDVYAQFVKRWCNSPIDEHLRTYLTASLQTVSTLPIAHPHVLATHLRLLPRVKAAKRAAAYCRRARESAEVWLARLDVEDGTRREETWREARRCAEGEAVWLWGLRDDTGEDVYEALLKESIAVAKHEVHQALLVCYVTRARADAQDVRRVLGKYHPTAAVFRPAFEREAAVGEGGRGEVLEALYEGWRRCAGEEGEAALAWAGWLVKRGKAARAASIVQGTGAEMRWREMLDLQMGKRGDDLWTE